MGSDLTCGKTAHAFVSCAVSHERAPSVLLAIQRFLFDCSRNTDRIVFPSGSATNDGSHGPSTFAGMPATAPSQWMGALLCQSSPLLVLASVMME